MQSSFIDAAFREKEKRKWTAFCRMCNQCGDVVKRCIQVSEARTVTDILDRKIIVPSTANRVISLSNKGILCGIYKVINMARQCTNVANIEEDKFILWKRAR